VSGDLFLYGRTICCQNGNIVLLQVYKTVFYKAGITQFVAASLKLKKGERIRNTLTVGVNDGLMALGIGRLPVTDKKQSKLKAKSVLYREK
jgi:hypothetical protein